MKKVSDALATIASNIGMDYVRTMTETEADVYVHNLNSDKVLMVYNGVSDISTDFDGAMIIDSFECQIFIVTKQTQKEMSGAQIDELLEITKRNTDAMYSELNKVTAQDIEPYTATAVQMFTDVYVGHEVTIQIPFYNAGCALKSYDFAVSDGGFTGTVFSWSLNNGWRASFSTNTSANILKNENLFGRTLSSLSANLSFNIFASAGNTMDFEMVVADGVSDLTTFDFGTLGEGNSTYFQDVEISEEMTFAGNDLKIDFRSSNLVGTVVIVLEIRALKYFIFE